MAKKESVVLDSLAVVLPRYGASLGGGAETLVRSLALRLVPSLGENCNSGGVSAKRVEIWTTCARDHRTWENYYQPGVTIEDGIEVHRFPVDERDLEQFIQCEMTIQEGRPLVLERQLDWLAQSVNSHGLYQHIAAHGRDFEVMFFAPYLFATTFWGSLIYPERSVIFPCLHNEAYAYLDVFHFLFRSVRGMFFNARGEMELAKALYAIPDFEQKSAVVGMGFDPVEFNPDTIERPRAKPYLLYSGRKETGKNLDLLIDYYQAFRKAYPKAEVDLVLIGSGKIEFLNELPDGVYDLGFVSEEEKYQLLRGALALCQPSVNESFSIVLMEAWLNRLPALVHSECAVTKDHVVDSGGGLHFSTAAEFAGAVGELLENEEMRLTMAAAGKKYVASEYSWSAVEKRLADGLSKLGLGERIDVDSGKSDGTEGSARAD